MDKIKNENTKLWKKIIDAVVLEKGGYQYFKELYMDNYNYPEDDGSDGKDSIYKQEVWKLYEICLDRFNRQTPKEVKLKDYKHHLENSLYAYVTNMMGGLEVEVENYLGNKGILSDADTKVYKDLLEHLIFTKENRNWDKVFTEKEVEENFKWSIICYKDKKDYKRDIQLKEGYEKELRRYYDDYLRDNASGSIDVSKLDDKLIPSRNAYNAKCGFSSMSTLL